MSEDETYEWLPSSLAEIAQAAGLDAAIALARKRGGREVYIPARLKPGHWLIETVGEQAAKAICAHFVSGVSFILPQGPAGSLSQLRSLADTMIRQNKTTAEIVEATGFVSRTVERRRARIRNRPDKNQMDLFK